ncbi:MAG: hypothetical protein HKP58_09565 [Desulfatitalea sp.]|nr:PD40 domain-containing protein [Desulfatitalea sp.]NNK00649.1 hypothetical protein [Desulfatitalea sp.]
MKHMGNTLNKTNRFVKNSSIDLIILLLFCFMVRFPKSAIYAGSFGDPVARIFPSDADSQKSGFYPHWMTNTHSKTAIYAWFPKGNIEQISPTGGVFYQACIHPAGTHVICSGNMEGAPLIWEMNLSTKEQVVLSPENAASIHGVYSWDGTKIAFSSDLNSGNPIPSFDVDDLSRMGMPPSDAIVNIFVMDADGSNIKQLTFGPYQDQRPTFSPDGRYIVFVRGYDDTKSPSGSQSSSTLWIVPTDGSLAAEVIPMDERAYRPWFSADGQSLYFFIKKSLFRHQICSIPVEGGDITPLAVDDGSQAPEVILMDERAYRPWFSADGERLFFFFKKSLFRRRICSIPVEVGGITLLATYGGSRAPEVIPIHERAYRRRFSADGERLYFFIKKSLFRRRICSMPVESIAITPLAADDKGLSHGPFVGAGGNSLLMHSNRDGKWNIYEVPLSGGEPVLLKPKGFDDHPVAHATRAVNGVVTFDSDGDIFLSDRNALTLRSLLGGPERQP